MEARALNYSMAPLFALVQMGSQGRDVQQARHSAYRIHASSMAHVSQVEQQVTYVSVHRASRVLNAILLPILASTYHVSSYSRSLHSSTGSSQASTMVLAYHSPTVVTRATVCHYSRELNARSCSTLVCQYRAMRAHALA